MTPDPVAAVLLTAIWAWLLREGQRHGASDFMSIAVVLIFWASMAYAVYAVAIS